MHQAHGGEYRRRSAQPVPLPGLRGEAAAHRPLAHAAWRALRRRRRPLSRIEDDRRCARPSPASYDDAIRFFADWNGLLAGYSDWFTRIDDATDFARAKAANKLGIMITFQNSQHFRRPDDVNTFWGLGPAHFAADVQHEQRDRQRLSRAARRRPLDVRAVDRGADESGRHGGGRVALRRSDHARRARGVEAAGALHARELPRARAGPHAAQDGRGHSGDGEDRRRHGRRRSPLHGARAASR